MGGCLAAKDVGRLQMRLSDQDPCAFSSGKAADRPIEIFSGEEKARGQEAT